MSSSRSRRSEKPRVTKVCARCRRKKIRVSKALPVFPGSCPPSAGLSTYQQCDFKYPTCGACALANEDCLGFDTAAQGNTRPRSIASYLEGQVAELEIELSKARTLHDANIFDTAKRATNTLILKLAQATAVPVGSLAPNDNNYILCLTSSIFLSEASRPYFYGVSPACEVSSSSQDSSETATISSIPRHVIDILLKNYTYTYLAQYPFLNEAELFRSCEKIFSHALEVTHFEFFSVAVALAISVG